MGGQEQKYVPLTLLPMTVEDVELADRYVQKNAGPDVREILDVEWFAERAMAAQEAELAQGGRRAGEVYTSHRGTIKTRTGAF